LAATNLFSTTHDVLIFLGNGDGTFQEPPLSIPVGWQPLGLAVGDFNGDGKADLAVANSGSDSGALILGLVLDRDKSGTDSVSVLLGRGDGTFQSEARYATGKSPDYLVAGDFNGDGKLDLAVSNSLGTDMSVLVGRGDGTFQDEVRFPVGDRPTPRRGLVAADFNHDGKLDVAAAELLTNDVSVALGSGNGGFQKPLRFPVGIGPVAVATGDFNSDGRLDVASVNPTTNDVAISLGVGDATLQSQAHFAVGSAPAAIVKGDFNRDGRLDLAVANYDSGDVSVLLGLGDGMFRQEARFLAGEHPVALVVGDFNGDGLLDLAVANAGSNDVSLLLGRGDGTFQIQKSLPAPDLPQALVTGDFNRDGLLDLATADYRSQDLAIFLGRGNGTFQAPIRLALGTSPVSLVADDFDGDDRLDLATANPKSNDVSVLRGRGDGSFGNPMRLSVGTNPAYVTSSDFNGDGRRDLATANSISQDVSFLLGRGDGTFADQVRRPLNSYPVALAGDDFTNDGRTDLAIATQLFREVSILQELGDMRFVPGGTISNPIHATPLVADWNGDGVPDVAVINRQGQILLRLARPGSPGVFEAPTVVNPDPRVAARDMAVISTTGTFLLAALDAKSSSLSFYSRRPDGTSAGPAIPGTLAVSVAAGDLNGDSRKDLVVADAGSNQVFVYLQNKSGGFGPTPAYQVGVGISPSAIDVVDVDKDGRPEIVVTNQFSGDVSVLRNETGGACLCESRFRAGTGLYWLDRHADDLAVRSREGTAGLVAGNFDDDRHTDLIVVNTGTNSFSVLRGNGEGGFANPAGAQTYTTGLHPTVVAAGQFNDDSYLDLAVLNEGTADVSIYLGDGRGGFLKGGTDSHGRAIPLSAGNAATGLTARDINGDGKADLLVGNDFGDLLALLGNGDGTFQPYQRADRNIALAVADLNGDGKDDFIFANEALDHVDVHYSQPGQTFRQDRTNGLLAPGAVSLADLNRDGIPDLLVANSGANTVLVYLGLGNGRFGPVHSFFAGTNPAGITVKDLNGDRLPDLVVANEGSNDVTILLGQGRGAAWTLANGPRLRAGAGPVHTTVEDVTGDGVPDILIANSQSNNVSLLRGLGGGFFNDQSPIVFPTGTDPRQVFAGNFDGQPGIDLITINAGSNDLTFFSDLGAGRSIGAGGERPVAAVAGDFNHDGIDDLIVANRGDGREALLFGSEDGPGLAEIFSLADVPHPTALALSLLGDSLRVFVNDEGTESAVLLTTFAMPIPATATTDERPPIADVFVLQGPGFSRALDVRVVPDLQVAEEVRPETAAELNAVAFAPLLVAGDHLPGDEQVAEQTAAEDDVNSFLLRQEELLHRRNGTFEDDAPGAPASTELIDQAFGQWLPAALDATLVDREFLAGLNRTVSESATSAGTLAFESTDGMRLLLPEIANDPVDALPRAASPATTQIEDCVHWKAEGDVHSLSLGETGERVCGQLWNALEACLPGTTDHTKRPALREISEEPFEESARWLAAASFFSRLFHGHWVSAPAARTKRAQRARLVRR
ncbi:MAG TPA: VCBS repeat-containing protein, partial [Gemmataceae bacterium]|nr:VCBS repeat-containing protein [Gemmataceae bacterium]